MSRPHLDPESASRHASIERFWGSWSEVRDAIGQQRALTAEEIEQLTTLVRSMHDELAWELSGTARGAPCLCVTPEGVTGLRSLTQRWADAAPTDDGWSYIPARLPTDPFHGELQLGDGERIPLEEVRISAEILDRGERCSVTVFHPSFRAMSDQQRTAATFLILDALIGEDAVGLWIGQVDQARKPPRRSISAGEFVETIDSLEQQPRDLWWQTLQGDKDGRPVIVVVHRPLKRLDEPLYDLHGTLEAAVSRDVGLGPLQDLEERLVADLGHWITLAVTETFPSEPARTVHVFTDPEGYGPDALEEWCARMAPEIYRLSWSIDRSWDSIQTFL